LRGGFIHATLIDQWCAHTLGVSVKPLEMGKIMRNTHNPTTKFMPCKTNTFQPNSKMSEKEEAGVSNWREERWYRVYRYCRKRV